MSSLAAAALFEGEEGDPPSVEEDDDDEEEDETTSPLLIDVPMLGSPSRARSTCPGLLMLKTTQSMPFSAARVTAVPSITASFFEATSA